MKSAPLEACHLSALLFVCPHALLPSFLQLALSLTLYTLLVALGDKSV
jgi:hypothetical protein